MKKELKMGEKSNEQLISKAAITSGSFGAIGLKDKEADQFIDRMVDESVLMKSARVVKMDGSTKKIDKLGLGGEIFRPAQAATDPGETVTISTSQIELKTDEVIAVVQIGDDSLEDNIEGDAFADHLIGMVIKQGKNELETALLIGEKLIAPQAGAWAHINSLADGWMTKARKNGHVVDANVGFVDRYVSLDQGNNKFASAIKHMPGKYRGLNNKLYCSDLIELDYLEALMQRGTALGDAAVMGQVAAKYARYEVISVPLLPTNEIVTANLAGGDSTLNGDAKARTNVVTVNAILNFAVADTIIVGQATDHAEVHTIAAIAGNNITLNAALKWDHANGENVKEATAVTNDGTSTLFTDPDNLILGIQRDIRIEPERRARLRATDFVITIRYTCEIEETDACTVIENFKTRP